MQPEKIQVWRCERNPNYWTSARIGLTSGLYWFPTSMVLNLRDPLVDLASAIFTLVIIIGTVIFAHSWLLVLGLAGFITMTEVDASEDENTRQNPAEPLK